MKVKNSFSIFFSNFSIVYKLILFLIVLTIIFSILGTACFLPLLNGFRKQVGDLGIDEALFDYLTAIRKGGDVHGAYNNLITAIHGLSSVAIEWNVNLIFAGVFLLIFIFFYAMLYFMSYYTITDILKNKMSAYSNFGFVSNYIVNMKKSFSFAILYGPMSLVMILIAIIGFFAILLTLTNFSLFLGFTLSFCFLIILLALRRTLFVYWIPEMVVNGVSAKDSFIKNFEYLKGNFLRIFGAYIFIYIVSFIFVAVSTIVTMGVCFIIMFAVCWYIMQILDMVEYYHIRGLKYYIDEQTVINPNKKYKDALMED